MRRSGVGWRFKSLHIILITRNKALPESLDALGKSDSAAAKSAPKENAWGAPILYSVSNRTMVILKTYGPGGAEADVKQTFTLIFDVNEK